MQPNRAIPLLLLSLAAVFSAGDRATALEIDFGYNPATNNRYLSGWPSSPVVNGNVLGMPGLDFSGVGWSQGGTNFNVTMITPRHFVFVNHAAGVVSPGTTITFLGGDGALHNYTVNKTYTTTYDAGSTSDLLIGELTTPLASSDQIRVYSVVTPGGFTTPFENSSQFALQYYLGQQIIAVGKNEGAFGGKIGTNTIDELGVFNFGTTATNTVGMVYDSDPNTANEVRLVGGDSGSPSFMMYNGQLTLLSVHSGIDAGVNPQVNVDSFIPFYVDQINAAIAGTGLSVLTISPIPEPSVAVLLAGAAAVAAAARTLRRSNRLSRSAAA